LEHLEHCPEGEVSAGKIGLSEAQITTGFVGKAGAVCLSLKRCTLTDDRKSWDEVKRILSG